MARARADLKVAASDALVFEAIHNKPAKSFQPLKFAAFGCVLIALMASSFFVFSDMLVNFTSNTLNVVPLISAPLDPIKVRPKQPGGLQVPNRDKLVYERIQKGTAVSGNDLIERLLPQSEEPLPKPVSKFPKTDREPSKVNGPPMNKEVTDIPTYPRRSVPSIEDVKSIRPPPSLPIAPKAAYRVGKNIADFPLNPNKQGPSSPETIQSSKSANKFVPSSSVSSVNKQKAVSLEPRKKISSIADSKDGFFSKEPQPSSKSYRIQLAAARTPERARSEWNRLRRKHLDLLGNLGLSVTKADLGPNKGIFYRLRVGPLKNEASARSLCKQLSKRKTGCLVVKPGR